VSSSGIAIVFAGPAFLFIIVVASAFYIFVNTMII
jgi:hypothetical protein